MSLPTWGRRPHRHSHRRPHRRGHSEIARGLAPLLLAWLLLSGCDGRGDSPRGEELPATILPPPADTIAPGPEPTEAPTEPAEEASEPTPDAPVAATATATAAPTDPPPTAVPTPSSTLTPTATPEPFAGARDTPPDAGILAVLEYSVPFGDETMTLKMPLPIEGEWPEPTFVRDVVLLNSRDLSLGRMFVGPDVPIVLEGWAEDRDVEIEVIDPTGDGTNHRARPGHPDVDEGGFVLRILPPAPLGTWTLRAKQADRRFAVGTFDLVSPEEPRLWVELGEPRPGEERLLELYGAGYVAEEFVPVHLYEAFENLGPDEDVGAAAASGRSIFSAVYAGSLGEMVTDASGQARLRLPVPDDARPSCWLVQTDPPALPGQPAFGPRMQMFHTWDQPEPGRFGFEAACRPSSEY